MAHFAELDGSNTVLRVIVLDNKFTLNENGAENENTGIMYLKSLFGENTNWKKTSYNTKAGIHYDAQTNQPSIDQSKAFRKNYAGINYIYDPIRDAFINPKPIVPPDYEQYLSFDEFSCLWVFNPPYVEAPQMEVTYV